MSPNSYEIRYLTYPRACLPRTLGTSFIRTSSRKDFWRITGGCLRSPPRLPILVSMRSPPISRNFGLFGVTLRVNGRGGTRVLEPLPLTFCCAYGYMRGLNTAPPEETPPDKRLLSHLPVIASVGAPRRVEPDGPGIPRVRKGEASRPYLEGRIRRRMTGSRGDWGPVSHIRPISSHSRSSPLAKLTL